MSDDTDRSFATLDSATLERLASGGAMAIDIFLLPRLRHLKKIYHKVGDPAVIYLAARSIADDIRNVPAAKSSFQYSKLLALIAEMLIAEGRDRQSLNRALDCISEAQDVLFRVNARSDEIIKAHLSYALYLGVIRKAIGKFDEAVEDMRKTKKTLLQTMEATDVDVVMLTRQEVIMQQELSAYRMLAEGARQYARARPMEYYGTIKRVLEFAMNKGMAKEARYIYPEFKRAFAVVSRRLPLLSHVSFMKNVGQYFVLQGEAKMAVDVLQRALQYAQELNMRGQERQIESLIADIYAERTRGLTTFYVE